MKQRNHTPEQIVGVLRRARVRLARGQGIDQICRALGITGATYHRWSKSYGSMPLRHVKRLKHLEKENNRLKRVVAKLTLEKAILQEAIRAGKPYY